MSRGQLAAVAAPGEAVVPVVVVCLACRLVFGEWVEVEAAAAYADGHDARHHSAYPQSFTVPGPDVPRLSDGAVVRGAGEVEAVWPHLYRVEVVLSAVGGDAA